MRVLPALITISILAIGCQRENQPLAVVVEENSPIVGPGGTTTEALGVETLGGAFTPLIKTGTSVPCMETETFSTAADGQSQIMISLFRGTNGMAADNHWLGRFQVVGIPAAPRGVPMVEVTFAIRNQKILLSARDLASTTDLEIRRVIEEATP